MDNNAGLVHYAEWLRASASERRRVLKPSTCHDCESESPQGLRQGLCDDCWYLAVRDSVVSGLDDSTE